MNHKYAPRLQLESYLPSLPTNDLLMMDDALERSVNQLSSGASILLESTYSYRKRKGTIVPHIRHPLRSDLCIEQHDNQRFEIEGSATSSAASSLHLRDDHCITKGLHSVTVSRIAPSLS